MHHLWCRRAYGQDFLTDVLLGRLHYGYGLRQLVFFAGELILIGSKLLYVAPQDGKIKRRGLKLCLQFC
jgi:hypothetical protein